MKTALIIHGQPDQEEFLSLQYPSPSNSHWLPWLQKELLINDYVAQTPEMPTPYNPNYDAWKNTFEQFYVNENSLLIGHSSGAGFLLRYLSENKINIKRTILVAPWLDPDNENQSHFFDFKIDSTLALRTDLHLFYSHDDMPSITTSVKTIKTIIKNIKNTPFSNHGHFCLSDMGTEKFPELGKIALHGKID